MEEKKTVSESRSEGNLHPKTVGRSAVLLGIAVLLFSALLVRIFLLQTVKYEHYRQKVLEQITTESSVNASRGNIYDSNGVLLATNVTTYRVFLSPSSIARAQILHDQEGSNIRLDTLISENLSNILGVSYEFVLKQTTYTKYLDRTIAREVDEDTTDLVRAFIDEYDLEQMIYLESTYTRYYPYSGLASHVLGFTGSDGTGLYGLEFQYNKMLSGTNGRYITARDSSGNEMPYAYKEYIPAQNGYNVNTTIDVFVQSALEEQLQSAYLNSGGQNRAAGIVMNVNTGEVLGMAVYPNFDLNNPRDLDDQSIAVLENLGYAVGSDDYNQIKQNLQLNMWSNKAITESYIPGSTFKVMTASMALEEDVVTLGETYSCNGHYSPIPGQTIHCHKVQGHGSLTFAEGIQQSCNPWLMRLGLRLGTNTFYSYLKAFGYLEKTGIDLPGEGGGVFAAQSDFTELDLAIYAFGQNFNVTLIQQITAVSAVANGGYLVTPHFVSSITDQNGNVIQSFDNNVRRQVVSESVCKTVADILEEGVSGNGGAKNAYVAGYRVAAKTGTSEKKERECPLCGYTANKKTVDGVSMFVCSMCNYTGLIDDFTVSEKYVCSTVAFAPADDPQYAIIIMVDEPTEGTLYGSVVAAPYVANVLETILPYLGVDAKYTDKELEKMAATVPSFIGWTVSAAENYCKRNGLQIEIADPEAPKDSIIRRQYPTGGSVVEKESARILAYTDTKTEVTTVTVPNVVGLTAVVANQKLIDAGLNIRIRGNNSYLSSLEKITSQSIKAGNSVPVGTVVEIFFGNPEDYDQNWDSELS